jgi:hypothetical protein
MLRIFAFLFLKKMIKKLFGIFLVLLLFLGCKTQVQIPSYIQISSYKTKVNSQLTSTENQNFTDMLVYANGQTYGIYPLGSKIPVLTSGSTSFLIRAVVEINGVGALRADYEVLHGCDTVITVQPGQVKQVVPVFEYFSTAQFQLVDDFNSGSINNISSGSPEIPFQSAYCGICTTDKTVATYTPGFSGNKNDKCIALKSVADTSALAQTALTMYLPAGGVGIYLEFDYQSNVEMQMYIIGADGLNGGTNTALTPVGGVYASSTWKKMYIDLTEQVSSMQKGYYYIYFGSVYDPSVASNLVLIDNVRVVSAQ